jgi:hypothetical protein
MKKLSRAQRNLPGVRRWKSVTLPVVARVPRDFKEFPFDPDELHVAPYGSNVWHDGCHREVLGFDDRGGFVINLAGVPTRLVLTSEERRRST